MMYYKRAKTAEGKPVQEPCWRAERFTRCRGMTDGLLAKNRFVAREPMEGGYFQKRQRELDLYEAAVEAYLLELAGPHLQDYQALREVGSEDLPPAAGAMPSGLTTGQMRSFRQRAAQASARRSKIAAAREQRARQAGELRAMAQAAEQKVKAAQAEINLELARYAKASRFCVVEREIPTVTRHFSAETFLEQYNITEA